MILISHIVNVSHKCIFNVWHFHWIIVQRQHVYIHCAGKTLLHNTERVCKWRIKKENQRKDYATRRAYCTVMTCVTCNLLAITRSYFKYHIWQSVRPPDMLELAYVTKSCIPKQEGRTHIKGIQICKNFSKLWKWFSSCALTHKQYLVKGYWTALGHPHENVNSLPSGCPPHTQSCQTAAATLEENLPRRIPCFQRQLIAPIISI